MEAVWRVLKVSWCCVRELAAISAEHDALWRAAVEVDLIPDEADSRLRTPEGRRRYTAAFKRWEAEEQRQQSPAPEPVVSTSPADDMEAFAQLFAKPAGHIHRESLWRAADGGRGTPA
jgi:hypothetical protein